VSQKTCRISELNTELGQKGKPDARNTIGRIHSERGDLTSKMYTRLPVLLHVLEITVLTWSALSSSKDTQAHKIKPKPMN
jgi:hypothetical protein